jgi:two-component system NtrC family sensor kinase
MLPASLSLDSLQQQSPILDLSADSIIIHDLDGNIIFANKSAYESRGYMKEEILGMKLSKIIAPEQMAFFPQRLSEIFKKGELRFESTHLRKDDSVFPVETHVKLIEIEGNKYCCSVIRDITERKRMNEALEEEKSFTENALNILRDIFVVFDFDGRYIRWNKTMNAVTGYSDSEIASMKPTDFFRDDDIKSISEAIQTVVKDGSSIIDASLVTKDGRQIPYEFIGVLLKNDKGDPAWISSVGRDITERKQAEEELKFWNILLTTLQETSPDGILVVDRNNKILLHNPRFVDMWHIPVSVIDSKSDELALQSVIDQIIEPEKFLERVSFLYAHPQETDACEVALKDGRIFERYSMPMLGGGEHYLGRVWYFRDITQRKQAEAELKRISAELNTVFSGIPAMIWYKDVKNNFILVNKATADLIGLPEQQINGKSLYDLFPAHQAEKYYRDDLEVINSGLPKHDIIEEITSQTGEAHWVHADKLPIRDQDGNIIGIIAFAMDITEKRQLEDQLRQAQKMEAVGQLAGGIAHDFNNILTAIIGFCHLLKMQTQQNTEAQEYINDIHKSANRAAELTQGLLAFSRKQVLNIQPVNVNEIIKNIKKILRRVIGEDIALITELFNEDIVIMADKSQLEHVLINLATNARDAMPKGGTLTIGTSTVRIGEERIGEKPGSYALITVSDTGMGISKEIQARIFEPFFTTKELGKGTGLGLATVYGVVKQHEGFINLYSEPGAGTIFKIYLPLYAGQTAEITGESRSHYKGGNETILIVEDEPFVRKVIKGILHDAGYSVFEAADGDEALDVFKENPGKIQMVILDVIMPKRGGREVYEELKRTSPEIKVLFMSGYSGEVLSRSGILDEQLNFISKPVEPDQLLIKIREMLDA